MTAIEIEAPTLWVFIQFVYYCYIRPGEIRRLKREYIDLSSGKIFIPAFISKNAKKESIPIFKEMEEWMRENQVKTLPASSIGKAINYTLNLWKRLVRYVDDGRCEIDNNLIENSIRPIAIGRKNYLFAGSHEAAQRAAMIYSFMATCKKNGTTNPCIAGLHKINSQKYARFI